MEKSLDKLIEFLLEEIAVCGANGATLLKLYDFTTSFYNRVKPEDRISSSPSSPADPISRQQNVDQRFIYKIWTWLGRHPDISIGLKKRHNSTPLQQFWPPSHNVVSKLEESSEDAPHIFVSEDRVYQALCGHPLDSNTIFPKEFALLSQIAASGQDGILQGELGRSTGQDKRSVPKRTDALRDKGYIIKQTVYLNGMKTSHLVLRKYATEKQANQVLPLPLDNSRSSQRREPASVQDLISQIFSLFTSETRLELDDISKLTGLTSDVQKKALTRTVRIMERVGCVKRVRMTHAPDAQSADLKTYIQFLRLPANTDSEAFESSSFPLDKLVSDLVAEETAKLRPRAPESASDIVDATLAVAQWNPDRCVTNVLSDAVHMAGSSAPSHVNSRTLLTGPSVPHQHEFRLSYETLLSQSKQLSPPAIAQASKLVEGSFKYAHSSRNSFHQATRDNSVHFSSMRRATELDTMDKTRHRGVVQHDTGSVPEFDDFGFPFAPLSRSVDEGGATSMNDLIRIANASDIMPREGEPHITNDGQGQEHLDIIDSRDLLTKASPPKMKPGRKFTPQHTLRKTLGRPRKFLRGTEKFWQYQFLCARRDVEGDKSLQSKLGTMNHPAGLAVFDQRPSDFDETLLGAKAACLPLPATAEDISEEWTRRVHAVLARSETGAYVTPAGIQTGRTKALSQLVIVRSNRLRELDFSNKKAPRFRFLTSSVAHSFPKLQSSASPAHLSDGSASKKATKAKRTPKQAHKKACGKARNQGPRLGIFVDTATSLQSESPALQAGNLPSGSLTATEYQQVMDDTELDSDLDQPPISSIATSRRSSRTTFATSIPSTHGVSHKSGKRNLETPARALSSGPKLRSRSSRRPKLTQKAAESLQDGTLEVGFMRSASPVNVDFKSAGQLIDDAGGQSDSALGIVSAVHDVDLFAVGAAKGSDALLPLSRSVENALQVTSVSQATAFEGLEIDVYEKAYTRARLQNDAPGGVPSDRVISLYHPLGVARDFPIPAGGSILDGNKAPTADTGSQEKENEQPPSGTESLDSGPATPSRSKKRRLSGLDVWSEGSTLPSPKRPKPAPPSPRTSSKLCRKILVELVTLASGAAPNDGPTFRRVMANRWQAEGGHDRPTRKSVNSNLKSLSESSQFRLIAFSFRGKGGTIKKKSILAHLSIDPTGPLIHQLRKKIIDADPSDYVPDAWVAETLPTLNASGNKRRREYVQAERPPIQDLPRLFLNQDVLSEDEESGTPVKPTRKVTIRRRDAGGSVGSVRSPQRRKRSSQASRTEELFTSPETELSATAAFLTLKVARIGEIPQVHAFNANLKVPEWNNHQNLEEQDGGIRRYSPQHLPAVSINSNPTFNSQGATAVTTPVLQRRSGLRRKFRAKHFDPLTHEIVEPLPKSLSAILETQQAADPSLKIKPDAGESARFFLECDNIEAWEIRCQNTIQAHDMKWAFVNHSVPDQPLASPIAYWLLVNVSRDGILTEKPSFGMVSWPPFIAALEEAAVSYASSRSASIQSDDTSDASVKIQTRRRENAVARRKRKLSLMFEDAPFTPKRKRNRVRKSSPGSVEGNNPSRRSLHDAGKVRASKHLNKMSAEELYRFTITTICVRTLTGGIEGGLHWSSVKSLLSIQEEEELLRDCWAAHLNKYASEIRTLTENFQERYIAALRRDEVPTVNVENIKATDWNGIVSWALKTLDTRRGLVNLPASRDEFFAKHILGHDETPSIRSVFHPAKNIDKAEREDLHRAVVFGSSLLQSSASDGAPTQSEMASRLRSFLLSLIICPADRYSQPRGEAKFYSIAPTETEVEILMQPIFEQIHKKEQLVAKRPGVLKVKGPREYVVTNKFYSQFGEKSCFITAPMLRDAIRHKGVLDELFARGENLEIPKNERVGAGEMLAIMQLLGMEMIEMRPGADLPNSRYGVGWQRVGYQSNKLEKGQFGFGVVVEKRDGYVFGDVVGKRTAVDLPVGDKDDPQDTPIWADVHGEVLLEVWEMVLGSVIGILSTRPGVDAYEISKSLGDAVGAWEILLMLAWAEKAGFVQKTGSGNGWETKEWWWLCLGTGVDLDEL